MRDQDRSLCRLAHHPRNRLGSQGNAVRRWLCLLAAFVVLGPLGGLRPAFAADPAVVQSAAADPKVKQWLQLLNDPAVQGFLDQARDHETPQVLGTSEPATMTVSLAQRLEALRVHLADLLRSSHEFSSQTRMAHAMALDALQQRGLWSTAFALLAFVVLGFGAQSLFHLFGRPFRNWLLALRLDTVDDRVRAVFARSLYGLGVLVTYAIGSIGAFLLFEWPELIKQLLLGYLVAFLIVRLTTIAGRFLLAPGAERFRVVPVSTRAAWFLYLRFAVFMVVLSFGAQSIGLLAHFGLSLLAEELSQDALGLVLLCIFWETVWRMPSAEPGASGVLGTARHQHRLRALVLSLVGFLLWLCWIVQAHTAFWLIAFATGLPIAISSGKAAVAHILRPAGTEVAPEEARSLQALLFARGMRSMILITAALLLAWIFGVDISSLTMQDTLATRLVRGAVSVAVIGLLAEFLWTVVHASIDRKMKQPLPHASVGLDAGHAARMQTLLPIVSNILLAAIVIIAAMMMLGALGVQIGPLIASAGVVGVAIGFGAQTLVKDIISGIFYLVDDAFRIGEYIQSGNYKGTVESFSLRSVKLRHQRGALYTIPFGSLGAVQNQSRDWVVDKIVMNVPYGTDLDRVRKIIKKIGTQLAEDPDFGHDIISPLKMQGVTQFGDYAIQIQTKMMTRPGDAQFMGRRRALLLIKLAFEENGIGFAVPTVQVSGDQTPAIAAQAYAINANRNGPGGSASAPT